MFTRTHFEKIAEVLKGLTVGNLANTSMGGFERSINSHGWHCETLIDCLCDLFLEENPRFDKKKFIEASGFEAWIELINGFPVIESEVKK